MKRRMVFWRARFERLAAWMSSYQYDCYAANSDVFMTAEKTRHTNTISFYIAPHLCRSMCVWVVQYPSLSVIQLQISPQQHEGKPR